MQEKKKIALNEAFTTVLIHFNKFNMLARSDSNKAINKPRHKINKLISEQQEILQQLISNYNDFSLKIIEMKNLQNNNIEDIITKNFIINIKNLINRFVLKEEENNLLFKTILEMANVKNKKILQQTIKSLKIQNEIVNNLLFKSIHDLIKDNKSILATVKYKKEQIKFLNNQNLIKNNLFKHKRIELTTKKILNQNIQLQNMRSKYAKKAV